MSLQINFSRLVAALSDALDLVGINDLHHGKRVAIISVDIMRHLGAFADELQLIFEAALLHDIGVSSSDLHRKLVENFDWEGSNAHARTGAALLDSFPPLARLAPIVRRHHTHWQEIADTASHTDYLANLIFLSDRIDVLAAVAMQENALLARIPQIRQQILEQAGAMFSPALVDAFAEVSQRESFWLDLEPASVRDFMEAQSRASRQESAVEFTTLRGMARLFSAIVDTKSHFTVEHSEGVARIALFLGETFGLSEEECDKLEIAGLLHDIGKLRIPDAILEKPGALSEEERRQMSSHAYETHRILTRIEGLEEIANWAAFHHETPRGDGYPFRLKAEQIPLAAQLLRAADIFQAMAQNRPYRKALPAKDILMHMAYLTEERRLDKSIYATLEKHLAMIYRLGQPQTCH